MNALKIAAHQDTLFVVLTDNTWPHAGLAALFPEIPCYKAGFTRLPCRANIDVFGRIIIMVDCQIFLSAKWNTFDHPQLWRPGSLVVWLTYKNAGRLFPVSRQGDPVITLASRVKSLRRSLTAISQNSPSWRDKDCVNPVVLSKKEFSLLHYFLAGIQMSKLSKFIGINSKTLHNHRKIYWRKLASIS